VVITDPPFGIGGKGYVDTTPWVDHVREVRALLPAVRYVIRGSGALWAGGVPGDPPRRLCVETAEFRRRDMFRPYTIPYAWHGWGVWGRLRVGAAAPIGTDVWPIQAFADRSSSTRARTGDRHGGVTPIQAAWRAIQAWTDPGMLVLDPFAGVGTIGIVAGRLGLDYLGAERDPRWHAEASDLLRNRQMMLDLADVPA